MGHLDSLSSRVDASLRASVDVALSASTPPRLAEAIRYAVFPGGGRLRPYLTLAVAEACGDADPALANAMAAGVELMHCASLVHDDMPCFDDADVRRGRPTVHRVFGEPMALLVGDALIVVALETIARASVASRSPVDALRLVTLLAQAAGPTRGLVAGQAWELEERASLDSYHRLKTAALFEAATAGGAIAGGADDEGWRELGRRLGEAYQIADDIADATSDSAEIGKPAGQDEAHARPNAVREHGLDEARARLRRGVDAAFRCLPPSAEAEPLRRWLSGAVGSTLLRLAAA